MPRAAGSSYRLRNQGKIASELKVSVEGSRAQLVDRALEELCEEEADEAAVLLARKLLRRHRGEDARREMQKVLAAMARRGYSYEDSRTAIEAAIRLEDEEE